MKGIFINCPECKGMMMKNAYLRPGSYLVNKCFNCGSMIEIKSLPDQITLKALSEPKRISTPIDDDDDEDILFIHG